MAQLLRQAIDSGAPPSLARIPMTPEEVAASYEEAYGADEDRADDANQDAKAVKHPSRVPRPGRLDRPGNDLAARFGRDGAHAEWFYCFRLAIRTDLGRRIVPA
jgi:hypothetical protein